VVPHAILVCGLREFRPCVQALIAARTGDTSGLRPDAKSKLVTTDEDEDVPMQNIVVGALICIGEDPKKLRKSLTWLGYQGPAVPLSAASHGSDELLPRLRELAALMDRTATGARKAPGPSASAQGEASDAAAEAGLSLTTNARARSNTEQQTSRAALGRAAAHECPEDDPAGSEQPQRHELVNKYSGYINHPDLGFFNLEVNLKVEGGKICGSWTATSKRGPSQTDTIQVLQEDDLIDIWDEDTHIECMLASDGSIAGSVVQGQGRQPMHGSAGHVHITPFAGATVLRGCAGTPASCSGAATPMTFANCSSGSALAPPAASSTWTPASCSGVATPTTPASCSSGSALAPPAASSTLDGPAASTGRGEVRPCANTEGG